MPTQNSLTSISDLFKAIYEERERILKNEELERRIDEVLNDEEGNTEQTSKVKTWR